MVELLGWYAVFAGILAVPILFAMIEVWENDPARNLGIYIPLGVMFIALWPLTIAAIVWKGFRG